MSKLTVVCGKLCFVLAGVILAAVPLCASSINDLPWNSEVDGAIGNFGLAPSNEPIFGETFTATADDNVLNSMTFYLDIYGGSIDYTADVYAWNGSATVGSALFTASPMTLLETDVFTPVTVSTGDVTLTPGDQYVAYLDAQSGSGIALLESFINAYSGGTTVLGPNPSDINAFPDDLAFDLEFADDTGGSVPEPATLTLFGAGLLALGRRWKRA